LHQYGNSTWVGSGASPKIDVAALTPVGSGNGWMYVGSATSQGAGKVGYYYSGSQLNVTAMRISGATSGETIRNQGKVLRENLSSATLNDGFSYTKVSEVECSTAVDGGDSGAPVFNVSNGLIVFAGVISGKLGDLCYYTPASAITAVYGGTPLGG
jgi:hypothetical protein